MYCLHSRLVSKPIQYFLMTSDWKRDVTGLLATAEHPLIVVLGPTASGKTAFSIALAKSIVSTGREAEIINADSRQLYCYLNIGTAKVTPKEMQGIPHHLIDVLDPKEEAAAGWYQGEARRVIQNMQKRGAVPVLVGGSMLYMSSVIDALALAPVPDPVLRARLIEEYDQDGGAALFARLQEIDPETADSIHRNNKPHLVRAVEIYELLKAPKSEAVPQRELRSDENVSEYDLLIFGMQWDREELCVRIDERTKKMFEEGWLEEVEDLLKKGYSADNPGMKSHGYREIMTYMEGSCDDLKALRELIAAKTRQYAKRQMSWWRGDSRIRWICPALQTIRS